MKFLLQTTLFWVMCTTHILAQSPVVQNCPNLVRSYGDFTANNAQLWNSTLFSDPSISTKDLGETAAEDFVTVRHYCPTPNPEASFILYLDLDFNNILETVVKSTDVFLPGTIMFNNANNNPGTLVEFDNRPVSGNEKYRFSVQTQSLSDSTFSARLVWITETGTVQNAQLPYGKHRIDWLISDGCGNSTVCQYNIEVKDTKKPTVVCVNGLLVNLLSPGTVLLWASDFLQYTEDNYTPVPQLVLAIRRSGYPDGMGDTIGFPLNVDGTPQTGVSFNCDDLGVQLVELWSKDKSGNADYCETYVLINDNAGVCSFQPVFEGKVTFCGGTAGVKDVHIEVEGGNGSPGSPQGPITDENGNFSFSSLPIASNACIGASKEINPLNGVNIFDNVLISRHILGIQPLDSPYKLIAADANKSGSVTTFDIVEFRKLILGVYALLPNNSSWRFVDASFVFTNPTNPFISVNPECIQLNNIDSLNTSIDFVGIKIGDVDCSADPLNLTGVASDRSVITFTDQWLAPEEEIILTFPGANSFASWQMTLQMAGLELLEFVNLSNLSSENFAYFPGSELSQLTFATELPNQKFELRLKAKTGGLLSSMLITTNDITPSFSYDDNGNESPLTLEFTSNTTELSVFSASLTPNPWTNEANLQFTTEQSGTGIFTVTNALGQVIYTEKQTFPTWQHTITLNRQQIPVAGTYWCRLALNGQVQVVKMIVKN